MFQLTKEQESLSMDIYGKIIRCIIAPYHNFVEHQKELLTVMGTNPGSVYVFPERDLTIQQRKGLVNTFVNSKLSEVNFITADLFIINDMINDCCRLLTPSTTLEPVYTKTFMANAHDIILSVLQNEHYDSKYKNAKNTAKDKINDIIQEVNNSKIGITAARKQQLRTNINLVGEKLITHSLLRMLDDVKTI